MAAAIASKAFTATPLGAAGTPGVLVEGLTREAIRDPQVAQQLRNLWIDVGLIVFRGLAGTETHLELSRVFGVLTSHPSGVAHNAVHPELSDIYYQPEDANIYEIDGRPVGGYLPWHSDITYFAEINRGGILRAIEPSKEDGRTGFLDQIAAYERLPQALRERIENLYVIYWGDFRQDHARYSRVTRVLHEGPKLREIVAKRDQFPHVAHPMVYVQKETGRKVLNVSPWFAIGIEGMQNADGDALLDEIVSHCSDERFAYFHTYQPEDMVLWDNWRMLHSATGVPPDSRRIMQRTTILGDYGLGRVLGEWLEADTLERVDV